MSVMVFLPEPKTVKIEMFNCTLCKQSFYYQRYLTRHMKRMHAVTQGKIPLKVHKCNLCEKSFSTKNYMYKHRMNVHGMSAKRSSIKCQEENCNGEFSTLSKFRNHLDSNHNFADYNVPEKLRFSSFADYIEWLVAEEKNTKCKFIRPRGRFKRSLYTGIDYTCSQNRHFFSKSSKQRLPETDDPQNTRYHCTAQILVKEFDDHVEALYFKRHYKHDFFLYNPKLLIRRKKTMKAEKKIEIIPSICETAFTLADEQYFSEFPDITDNFLNSSSDLCIESLMKQLNSIHSKLLSKTSIDIHMALKVSESLQTVEQLLDNDIVPNNIMPSCKIKESDKNCNIQQKKLCSINAELKSLKEKQCNVINISANKMFVSTNPANDHDYDKI